MTSARKMEDGGGERRGEGAVRRRMLLVFICMFPFNLNFVLGFDFLILVLGLTRVQTQRIKQNKTHTRNERANRLSNIKK